MDTFLSKRVVNGSPVWAEVVGYWLMLNSMRGVND
jgi:hypothetical protein